MAANQSMSPLHVRSYLHAADRALDEALVPGPRPATERHTIDYAASRYLSGVSRRKALGQGMIKRLDDAYVAFFDFGSTYTFHSASEGYAVPYLGRYRVTIDAYPYQADTPVGLLVYQGVKAGVVASLDQLVSSFDLTGDGRQVEVTRYMRPGDLIALTVADLDFQADDNAARYRPAVPSEGYGGMLDYPGEGVALRSMTFEGAVLRRRTVAASEHPGAAGGCPVQRGRRDPAHQGPLCPRRGNRRVVRAASVP